MRVYLTTDEQIEEEDKLTPEQFEERLMNIRRLARKDLEEIEKTNAVEKGQRPVLLTSSDNRGIESGVQQRPGLGQNAQGTQRQTSYKNEQPGVISRSFSQAPADGDDTLNARDQEIEEFERRSILYSYYQRIPRNPHQNPHGHQKPTHKRSQQETIESNRRSPESIENTGLFTSSYNSA